jgi:hypothetical protein
VKKARIAKVAELSGTLDEITNPSHQADPLPLYQPSATTHGESG